MIGRFVTLDAWSVQAQAFEGEATIICNRPQRDELHRKGAAYIEMFKGLGPSIAAEISGVELADPDVIYDGQAEIDLGGHRAVLRSWGPAHTAGDQTILVDGRVLFGGDLFETRMFPIVPYFPPADTDVDGSRWITVLDQLIAFDPAVVVPGHGEVTDVSLIRDVRDYLNYVRGQASRLRASGASADDAAAAIEQAARAAPAYWRLGQPASWGALLAEDRNRSRSAIRAAGRTPIDRRIRAHLPGAIWGGRRAQIIYYGTIS